MKIRACFLTIILGVGVVTGIFKGLASPRGRTGKKEGEKEVEKEKSAGAMSEIPGISNN